MDDELTPHQEERVRRLLAEARHTEPMPEDVAARLDRVIAGLADEPKSRPAADGSPAPDGASVVRLDERRRRGGRLLLAAAAVVVGGVAVGQLVGDTAGEDEASSPAAETADDQGLPAPDRDTGSGGEVAGNDEELPGAVSGTRRSISQQPPVLLRSSRFTGDARALAPGAAERRKRGALAQSDDALAEATSCPPGAWGGGRYVRVVLDREPGWLVYRPPRGDTRVVDLFLCDADTPERSATLPLD